ncbi:MAG: hypothetical protein KatS3mg080_0450 [Anoxybacillus sp.]|nr:MAG: hypothetical protein KatS3mg080_0450 [Anoxybacillus sp.]
MPSYGHHAHVAIFGAVDVQQGDVVFHRASSANAETFLDFLRLLKEKYSDRFIVLVLDNAHIHHANMVQAFLQSEEGDAFHFMFLPPYLPHLNPIERLWKWLKDEVIANILHKDQNDMPCRLLGLNNMSYSTQMRCYAASGVLRKPEVKMSIWMYI